MADWYASPTGNSGNAGTLGSPWDIETAFLASTTIGPGDTLWLLEGTYYYPDRDVHTSGMSGWKVTLQGSSGSPIWIRPHEDARVTIDGGLHSTNSPQRPEYLRFYGLEVIVSENLTETRVSTTAGVPPPDLVRPWGGMDIAHGLDIKIINCIIHHNMQGIGFWSGVIGDSELYGNIIYDNGWIGSDRPHGHGIYSQNPSTTRKYMRNNIIGYNASFNVHFYGSNTAATDNITLSNNFSYGLQMGEANPVRNTLTGGLNESSNTGFRIHDNVIFHSQLTVGFGGRNVDDVEITGNTILAQQLNAPNVTNAVIQDNWQWREQNSGGVWQGVLLATPDNGEPVPEAPFVFIEPNEYDSSRFHLAVMNFFQDAEVEIDFAGVFSTGQSFYLLDPTDFYGLPVYANTYQGSPLMVPTGGKMFVPFVAIQADAPPAPVSVPASGFIW